MLKRPKHKILIVLWKDAKIYHKICRFHKGEKILLTSTKCQGEIHKEDKDWIVLKNCRQSVFNEEKRKFIFKRKANFFFIPKGMVVEINN